ncbi:Crp/Fnr family transcriptional regulator [Microvirga sp. KLBC 81]|uniref:Crp/Fnr family transcriptional regulator n=1 Tax=Microvirga sp. KLBC 81 TaxID=1862707 RepID=UPI000D5100D7|nr:Crp/Fnr family transcriptional regulator [Microvirga sp. KLBC 81]PVE24118.1 Crp/Fnr family transcriptional regulator [Microvirga sp. KLBC 81]
MVPAASPSDHHPLVRKLESIFTLTDDERQALLDLPMQATVIKEDQDVVREGDRPSRSFVILSGFTGTYKVTGDGRRQIVAFCIPGDMPDVQSLHLKVLDISVATLTPCSVGFITHEALWDLCLRYPRITAAFWRETLVEAASFREWLLNVGQREAYHRMAHILCELLVRLRAVGLAEDHVCDLPITQAEFADALGVSTVHVNRVLQELRADGLIETRGTQLIIPDWEKLKQAGDFDETYLHLKQGGAAA